MPTSLSSNTALKPATENATPLITTRVFQNGNSQALRIPQDLRTDKKEFFIRKISDTFIAYPTDDPWAPARQVIGTFPEDFMSDRNQPSWDDVTAREGL